MWEKRGPGSGPGRRWLGRVSADGVTGVAASTLWQVAWLRHVARVGAVGVSAALDESLDCARDGRICYVRSPNSAVPMRMWVAPSRAAVS